MASALRGALALRIDHSLSDVIQWLNRLGCGGFGVREVSGEHPPQRAEEEAGVPQAPQAGVNEHWHFLLYTEHDVKSVRSRLLYAVPSLKGNGSYSLTVCRDLDKYIRYMCKGESEGVGCEVVWMHGLEFNDLYFEEQHVAYWAENRKLRKRQRGGALIDSVTDQCKALGVQWTNRSKIAEVYTRELVARGRPLNAFSSKSAINTIQVYLCPDDQALLEFASQL